MNTVVINIKTDRNVKKAAKKLASQMGLSLSAVINAQLKQFVRTKRLEINMRTENSFTPEFEDDVIKETEYAEKHGKSYKNVKDLINDLSK